MTSVVNLVSQRDPILPNGNASDDVELSSLWIATIEQLYLHLRHLYRDNEIENGSPLAATNMNSRLDNQIVKSIVSLLIWGAICIIAIGAIAISNLVIAPSALALDYNKGNLVDTDFSGRDLTDSSFNHANLRNSNFSHSNLNGISLFAANLESANLEGADLSNVTLDSARLTRANLTNAVLEGAFMANAKFDGAIIDGADFTDVLLRRDEQQGVIK